MEVRHAFGDAGPVRCNAPWQPLGIDHGEQLTGGLHGVAQRPGAAAGTEQFLVGAAAAGVNKLPGELEQILTPYVANGEQALLAALQRAAEYKRWRADDVRSILAAAGAAPLPRPAREALVLTLPQSRPDPCRTTRSVVRLVSTTPPPLAVDLNDGLEQLKMAAMRCLAPELLVTAKTQRWSPEECLRTRAEAENTARDESNARTRMRTAVFPVVKTLEEIDLAASSIPRATFDYLASLEWIRSAETHA